MNDSAHILIAEDSPTQAARLRYLLEGHGYTVTVAADGKQALAAIQEHQPTLVISDIVMPEMDGYTLCKAIKSDENLKDLPVILVTVLSDPQDIIAGLQCGADNFIMKPYDERYLLSHIQYILINRELRQSETTQMGVEIYFGGQRHFITSERQQILGLLLSTYETAVQKNLDLIKALDELRTLNERLEERVKERTAALTAAITEHKRTEEALKASQEYARSIIDSSLDMIIAVDGDRKIIEFNRAAQETFGYRPEEVLGKYVDILYADPQEGLTIHKTTVVSGQCVQEILNRRKNGEVFPSFLSASILRDARGEMVGAMGISRDITGRRRAEEALRQAEEKYRSIFENAVEGIFQATTDGRYVAANPALARMYGYESPEELIASVTDIAHQLYVDPNCCLELRRLLQEHDTVLGFESQVYRKDGSVIWISESARGFRGGHGTLLYYEGTVEDISQRRRAEEERERLIRELQDALAKVETLSGLLPICASCKKIRDDKGYWHQVEVYIRDHSDAEFIRGLCPDCGRKISAGYGFNL